MREREYFGGEGEVDVVEDQGRRDHRQDQRLYVICVHPVQGQQGQQRDNLGVGKSNSCGILVHPHSDPLTLSRVRAPLNRLPTRWSTTLSSEVDLHNAIDFRAACGANLVTLRSKIRPNETRVLHRAARQRPAQQATGYAFPGYPGVT